MSGRYRCLPPSGDTIVKAGIKDAACTSLAGGGTSACTQEPKSEGAGSDKIAPGSLSDAVSILK